MDIKKYIKIDETSRIPKYRQIVNEIINGISNGNFEMGNKIPSINFFSETYGLSRDTVEKAYKILKNRQIIISIRGKGFYITRTKLISKVNILFLINKLSPYKMHIYNSFIKSIGANSHTSLHIYHCDQSLFLDLLNKNIGGFDYYVIMPHFKTEHMTHISGPAEVVALLEKISPDKLVLLDNNKIPLKGEIIEIFQDYENDIYNALKEGLFRIKKYAKLFLVFRQKNIYPYPKRILTGFRKFCVENNLEFEIINDIYEDMILKKGDLFITIEEADLVNIVKEIREKEYVIGEDIGIISYNDTPLKELLGITVITTDFKAMGATAANMILNKEKGKVKNPFHYIDRGSI